MKSFKARQAYLLFSFILSVLIISGCGGSGGGGQWLPPSSPDTTAPTVTAVVPLNNAANVAYNTKIITAAFSKTMDPSTLTATSFTLACTPPDHPEETPVNVIVEKVTYLAAGNVATLTIAAESGLPHDTLDTVICIATIKTGTRDLSGNALARDFVWTFNPGQAPDVAPPTVPGNTDIDVFTNTKITVTFDEAMDPSTLNAETFIVTTTEASRRIESRTTAVEGDVTYVVGSRTAVFTPTNLLLASKVYTATITTGARDIAGNAMLSDYVWSFTTSVAADIIKPTVTAVVPPDNAPDVAVNTKIITVTFSEAMYSGTLTTANFTLECPVGTPVTETLVSYQTADNVATLTLPAETDLPHNTVCTATVTTGATDLAGNQLVGDPAHPTEANNYVWTFKTGTAPDTTAPIVSAVVFDGGATDMCINNTITATFSEAMNPDTINRTTFILKQGATGISGDVAYSGVTAVFTPDSDLLPDTPYTVTITTGAEDLAGNALSND